MLGIILAGIIIAAVAGFIIWKPWIDLWDYLKRMKESGGSLSKNNIGQICRLSKFLLIPALLVGLIVLYCYFASNHKHAFTETIVREATCKEEGVVRVQCRYCDYQYEKQLPLIAHKYEEVIRTEPTCEEQGTIVYTCEICKKDTKTETISVREHKYVVVERNEPNCSKAGQVISRCEFCGREKSETLPANEAHQYQNVKERSVKRSFWKNGYDNFVCQICNSQYYQLNRLSWFFVISAVILMAILLVITYLFGYKGDLEDTIKNPILWICAAAIFVLGALHELVCSRQLQELCGSQNYSLKVEGFNLLCGIGLLLIFIILFIALIFSCTIGNDNKSLAYIFAVLAGLIVLIAVIYAIFLRKITVYVQTDIKAHLHENDFVQQSFNAYADDPKPISIAWAEASSVLSTESYTISIDDSYDGDLDTCWQDGVDGNGEGEILTYHFEHPCYVVGMDIVNGPVISENNYYENNRIRSMTLYYLRDGDVTATVQLKDIKDVYSREAEYYTLASEKKDEAYYCDAIKIVIDSVYKGSVYKDLCLTEIKFYGIYE